jgi:hypothetical protein
MYGFGSGIVGLVFLAWLEDGPAEASDRCTESSGETVDATDAIGGSGLSSLLIVGILAGAVFRYVLGQVLQTHAEPFQ